RCRELRVVRQLHVKCDCEKQDSKAKKNLNVNATSITIKKRRKLEVLRPIAPKQETESISCCSKNSISSSVQHTPSPPAVDILQPSIASPLPLQLSSSLPLPSQPSSPSCSSVPSLPQQTPSCCSQKTPAPAPSCCSKKPSNQTAEEEVEKIHELALKPVPLPNIPPPTSCCGPALKNQQGETIRVVTCRCGDSCACIGCDAHPSRAMKEGTNDVYIGFDSRKRLSISSFLSPRQDQVQQEPSSILLENGISLCGCGCSKTLEECPGCFEGFLCSSNK
ncbi:hypothetical protein CU098_012534, partial [Rhizopus stolonifer]